MSSTKKTTVTRPVKAKVVPKTTETAAEPVATEAPADVATAQPVTAVVEDAKTKRQQTSKTIGISISSARTRRHVDKLNLNKAVEEELTKLKVDLTAHDEAAALLTAGGHKKTEEYTEEVTKDDGNGNQVKEQVKKTREVLVPLTAEETATLTATVARVAPMLAELHGKITALSRERVRFANDAPVALSIVCDKLIQQLIVHAMTKVLAAKKKIVQVSHLHEAGVEQLSLYPLIKSLPSFVQTSQDLAAAARTAEFEKAVKDAKEQAFKEFKKQYADVLPKKKKGQAAAVAPAPAEPVAEQVTPVAEEEDDSADSKTTFKFYVSQVCKEVIKGNLAYTHVRISTDIRNYLSNLLIELIRRLSSLILLTTEDMKIKTVNDVAILNVVKKLLVDGHEPTETITFRQEQVPDPEAVKAELQKKEEAKKAGTEYKVDLEKLPKVAGYVAVRSVSYESSGYAQLAQEVADKLKVYREHSKETADE